jgi:hypothetical protein
VEIKFNMMFIGPRSHYEPLLFEISLTRSIKASKEFVFDWWTDFSPRDTSLVKPLKSRQIISKTPNLILLRDEEQMYFKRMAFDIKVLLLPNQAFLLH